MTTFESQTSLRKTSLELLRSTKLFAHNIGRAALSAINAVPQTIHEVSEVSHLTFDGAHALTPENPETSTALELGATLPLRLPLLHSNSPRHSREINTSLIPVEIVINKDKAQYEYPSDPPQLDIAFLYTHPHQLAQPGIEIENTPLHKQ